MGLPTDPGFSHLVGDFFIEAEIKNGAHVITLILWKETVLQKPHSFGVIKVNIIKLAFGIIGVFS